VASDGEAHDAGGEQRPCRRLGHYHGDAFRDIQSRDQGGVHRRPRGGVFANRSAAWCSAANVRDKQIRSRDCDAIRDIQPRDREAFTVAPEVVSSPIVLLETFV